MNNKTVTYTGKLPALIMHELSEYASVNNKKKNEVIVEAITEYLITKRKSHYAESFKRMKNDPEQRLLAEAW